MARQPETVVRASAGTTRVYPGDQFAIQYTASAAPTNMQPYVIVEYDRTPEKPPVGDILQININSFTTDRTQVTVTGGKFTKAGTIVGGSISGSAGSLKRGQFYAFMGIIRGNGNTQVLAQGYFYANHAVSIGDFVEPGPGGGEGNIQSIDLGDPAAGSDYTSQTVPTNALWIVRGWSGTLVTDATAANRAVRVVVTDGTVEVFRVQQSAAHTASQTIAHSQRNGSPVGSGSFTGTVTFHESFPEIPLPEGYVLDWVTNALQAADNWGDGQLLVEEWLVV